MAQNNNNFDNTFENEYSKILYSSTSTQEIKLNSLVDKIKKQIHQKDYFELRKVIHNIPLIVLREAYEKLNSIEELLFFRFMTTEQAVEFFSSLEVSKQRTLINHFTDDLNSEILNSLNSSTLKDLVEELPSMVIKEILSKVNDSNTRNKVNILLTYEDNQIGSVMSADVSTLRVDWSVEQSLEKMANDWRGNSIITHYYFVTNKKGQLVGAIRLENIIFNRPEQKISEIMFRVEAAKTFDDLEKAARLFSKQDLSVLPVVNDNNYLAGVVTTDQIVDILNEEATEDIYKAAGINVEDASLPYTKTSIKKLVKSRVFWLVFLLLGSTISQIVIQALSQVAEGNIQRFISVLLLTTLVPVISGAAGNAGSQASSTVIRAAALGEFENYPLKKIVYRELSVAFLVGFVLFFVNSGRLLIYYAIDGSLVSQNSFNTYILIFASSLSLWVVIIWAKLLGTLIPLIALKFKKDPTVLSTPLLTTLSDGLAVAVFYGMTILLFIVLGVAI